MYLKEIWCEHVNYIHLTQNNAQQNSDYERGNESSGTTKGREKYVYQLTDRQLLKKNDVLQTYTVDTEQ